MQSKDSYKDCLKNWTPLIGQPFIILKFTVSPSRAYLKPFTPWTSSGRPCRRCAKCYRSAPAPSITVQIAITIGSSHRLCLGLLRRSSQGRLLTQTPPSTVVMQASTSISTLSLVRARHRNGGGRDPSHRQQQLVYYCLSG